MNAQRLSATGRKWVLTMRQIYTADRLQPIIERAAVCASVRGGRVITADDLNDALDLIAREEVKESPPVIA